MFRINYSGSVLPLKLSSMLLFGLILIVRTQSYSDSFYMSIAGHVATLPNGTVVYVFGNTTSKPSPINTTPAPYLVPNYPAKLINELMRKDGDKFHEFFGNDTEELDSRSHKGVLCRSEIKIRHHQTGVTESNTWVLIVNTDDFMQGVNEEICRENGKALYEYRGVRCVQVFNYRRLVTFDNSTNKFEMKNIRLLSGCHAANC